jgi:hypothetical protein
MRSLIVASVLAPTAFALSAGSSQGEFLLNCRQMDRDHPRYEQYCQAPMAGYIIQKCSKRAGCTIIKQNFKSIYSSAAISGGNTQPLATAAQSQVSATTAGVASTAGGVVQGAGNTVGDAVTGTSNTVRGTVSGVTNTLGNTVSRAGSTLGLN